MAITSKDVREEDADPGREDQIRAEALEIERARATVGAEIRADGGTDHAELREGETRDDDNVHARRNQEMKETAEAELEDEPIDIGDHVQDREDPDATMVVVNLDTLRADAYELESGPTVADVNPEYPPKDDVVEVKYPKRTDVTLDPLKEYAFPRSRLEVVAHVHDRDGEGGDN